jgi:hypothetical protein
MESQISKQYRKILFELLWAEFDRLERRLTSVHIDALPAEVLQHLHESLHSRNKMIDQYVGAGLDLDAKEVTDIFDKRDGVFTRKRGEVYVTKEEKAFVKKQEKKPRKNKRPAKSQAAAKATNPPR